MPTEACQLRLTFDPITYALTTHSPLAMDPQQQQREPISTRGEIDFLWNQHLLFKPDVPPRGPARGRDIKEGLTPLCEAVAQIDQEQQELAAIEPEDDEHEEELREEAAELEARLKSEGRNLVGRSGTGSEVQDTGSA